MAQWAFNYASTSSSNPNSNDLMPFINLVQQMSKNYRKEKRIISGEKNCQSMIREKKFPKNGILELMQLVEDSIISFHEVINSNESKHFLILLFLLSIDWESFIDGKFYLKFIRILFASLYTFSVQGRIGGIESLRYSAKDDLLKSGYGSATTFKTASYYGHQAVILPPKSRPLFELYLQTFRPYATKGKPSKENDPLWLNSSGEPFQSSKMGKAVTKFFKSCSKLHITTTNIRSLIETQAQMFEDMGSITSQSRASITALNGHTSQVAQDYYVQRSQFADVQASREFFQKVSGSSILHEDTNESFVDPTLAIFNATTDYEVWGVNHPDFEKCKDQQRAIWSKPEIDFIGKWCSMKLKISPESRKRLVSLLYKHIKGTNSILFSFNFDSFHK
jgi:hypothetical protein